MNRYATAALVADAIVTLGAAPLAPAQQPVAPDSSGYVAANGVRYWYEIHGKGEPLLLLHGGLFSTGMFGPTLTKLAETHRVIGVDLHGHGHTALGERQTISLVDIGRDLAVVVEKLGLRQVDVMGYSFGGGAALQLAFQHPELVRRLVVVSAPYAQNGFFAEMLRAGRQWGRVLLTVFTSLGLLFTGLGLARLGGRPLVGPLQHWFTEVNQGDVATRDLLQEFEGVVSSPAADVQKFGGIWIHAAGCLHNQFHAQGCIDGAGLSGVQFGKAFHIGIEATCAAYRGASFRA